MCACVLLWCRCCVLWCRALHLWSWRLRMGMAPSWLNCWSRKRTLIMLHAMVKRQTRSSRDEGDHELVLVWLHSIIDDAARIHDQRECNTTCGWKKIQDRVMCLWLWNEYVHMYDVCVWLCVCDHECVVACLWFCARLDVWLVGRRVLWTTEQYVLLLFVVRSSILYIDDVCYVSVYTHALEYVFWKYVPGRKWSSKVFTQVQCVKDRHDSTCI